MIEDVSDDRRILDGTDDPHRPLTFRADQGIYFVYLLNKPGPTFPERLFVSLRYEDARDGVIQTFLLAFSSRDVAVVSVVTHHLLAPVRDVRTHRGQPFHRREVLGCLSVLGCINDRPHLIQVLHTFQREGRPDDVTRQIFHGRIISRRDAVAAEDVESGMPPCGEHGDQLLRDLPLVQEHPEYLVPEDGLQLLEFKGWRDAEHAAITIETAVRHEDVAVGIESEEIAEGLHGDDGAGDGIPFGNDLLHEDLYGFPCAAAEIGKKLPVIEEIPTEDFRDAEDEMTVRNLLEDIRAEPFPEFHHPLLMA